MSTTTMPSPLAAIYKHCDAAINVIQSLKDAKHILTNYQADQVALANEKTNLQGEVNTLREEKENLVVAIAELTAKFEAAKSSEISAVKNTDVSTPLATDDEARGDEVDDKFEAAKSSEISAVKNTDGDVSTLLATDDEARGDEVDDEEMQTADVEEQDEDDNADECMDDAQFDSQETVLETQDPSTDTSEEAVTAEVGTEESTDSTNKTKNNSAEVENDASMEADDSEALVQETEDVVEESKTDAQKEDGEDSGSYAAALLDLGSEGTEKKVCEAVAGTSDSEMPDADDYDTHTTNCDDKRMNDAANETRETVGQTGPIDASPKPKASGVVDDEDVTEEAHDTVLETQTAFEKGSQQQGDDGEDQGKPESTELDEQDEEPSKDEVDKSSDDRSPEANDQALDDLATDKDDTEAEPMGPDTQDEVEKASLQDNDEATSDHVKNGYTIEDLQMESETKDQPDSNDGPKIDEDTPTGEDVAEAEQMDGTHHAMSNAAADTGDEKTASENNTPIVETRKMDADNASPESGEDAPKDDSETEDEQMDDTQQTILGIQAVAEQDADRDDDEASPEPNPDTDGESLPGDNVEDEDEDESIMETQAPVAFMVRQVDAADLSDDGTSDTMVASASRKRRRSEKWHGFSPKKWRRVDTQRLQSYLIATSTATTTTTTNTSTNE